MTWPDLPTSMVMARVLGTKVVLDQRSGVLARLDEAAALVVEHRHLFADRSDAAVAIVDALGGEKPAVEADLEALAAMLAELHTDDRPTVRAPNGPRCTPPASEAAAQSWTIDALGVPVEVRAHGAVLSRYVAPLLAGHPPSTASPTHRFDVWEDGGVTVTQDGRLLYADVELGVALDGLSAGITVAAILAPRETLLIHAAAVADDEAALLIGGGSGSGKSSTTVELLERGLTFLTDEVVELDPGAGAVRGLPRPIGLEGPARDRRPGLRPEWSNNGGDVHRWPVPPGAVGTVGRQGTLRLSTHLEFTRPASATVTRLDPLEGVARLCALTFNRERLTADALGQLGLLLAAVPSVVVHHGGASSAADAILERWSAASGVG